MQLGTLLDEWQRHYGVLTPEHKTGFVRRPEAKELCRIPRAVVLKSVETAGPRLTDILDEATRRMAGEPSKNGTELKEIWAAEKKNARKDGSYAREKIAKFGTISRNSY